MRIPWRTPEPWARLGLAVQFLALIRCLGEYLRLKQVQGLAFVAADAEIFIVAALVVAVLTAASVAAYVLDRRKLTAALAALTVVVLLFMKGTMMG